MDKDGLPRYSPVDELTPPPPGPRHRHRIRKSRALKLIGLGCLAFVVYAQWAQLSLGRHAATKNAKLLSIERLQQDLSTCAKLQHKPKDPSGPRERNARYIDGHKPTLIRNATVWTGEPVDGKYGWIKSDVLLEYGLIIKVEPSISNLPKDTLIYDAGGRQLTAGIVDMHSHTGVYPLPSLWGDADGNEVSGDITPYVRSIDGLHPLDPQLQVIKSGGITTSLVLPGSANNMGGEAFLIKHAVGLPDGRTELGANDMLADPEHNWRYMKMACGENPKRVYGSKGGPASRLGESWFFRHAFEEASALVKAQDDWCSAAAEGVEKMETYLPQELKWESLGALLRGQVLLNTHCYTIPDLEAFVDHTNEFNFSVRAFHHAHETHLVPEILKRTWGGRAPASALFADNMYYKVESYRGSEQAGKILYENGLTPIYVSDNPVLNAQHLVFEAAKAYRYGLPYHVALAGVTSAPAEHVGLGERIGKIKSGFDADVVVWDSDPLSVGATPVQVWIDGTAQYSDPAVLSKPASEPIVPDSSLNTVIKEDPSIEADLVFTGVSQVMIPGKEQVFTKEQVSSKDSKVVVKDGKIVCAGECSSVSISADTQVIELTNGFISPPFTSFGSYLGLQEIRSEGATVDGDNHETFSRAVDGLHFDTKNLKVTFAHGVTKAITAPTFRGGASHHGVSAGYSTGALHPLEKGAVWADEVALHYTLGSDAKGGKTPSISSAVGAFRQLLLKAIDTNETEAYSESYYLKKVLSGEFPLVLTAHSSDVIAAILRVKSEVEASLKSSTHNIQNTNAGQIRLVLIGASEAHLVAKELAAANVSVVVAPLLSYGNSWEERRFLPGAPMTNSTTIDVLIDAGVLTAIGTDEDWEVRDLNLMAGIAYKNGGGRLSQAQALALVSSNIDSMLGLSTSSAADDFVAFEGSPLEIDSRVKAVGSLGKVYVY